MNKNIKESLDAIQNAICSFDSKSTSLLTAVGIIFSFSLFSIDNIITKDHSRIFWIFIALYLFFFLVSIFSLVLVIFPRGRNRKERKTIKYSKFYQRDIYILSKKENFSQFLKSEASDDVLVDQIRICARISNIKRILLIVSIFSIVLMCLFLCLSCIFFIL